MKNKTIGILGSSGFVGRHLLDNLSAKGYKLVAFVRHKSRSRDLAMYPNTQVVEVDIHNESALTNAIRDCDIVINLVGILHEDRFGAENTFENIHVNLPHKIVKSCNAADIERLMHISAINADPAALESKYLASKGEGENIVLVQSNRKLKTTVFKPSIIFGSDDSFINMFADMLRWPVPVLPLACPNFKLAPIAVEDVVGFIINVLDDTKTFGKVYNLCGKETYTLHKLVLMVKDILGRRTRIIPLSNFWSKMQALILGILPGKMFTLDNFYSLQKDAICDGKDNVLVGKIGLKARLSGIVDSPKNKDKFSYYRKHD